MSVDRAEQIYAEFKKAEGRRDFFLYCACCPCSDFWMNHLQGEDRESVIAMIESFLEAHKSHRPEKL